jgi:hypothetical protein
MLTSDQQQVQNYGNTYSNELSNMDAAVQQRQEEGLGMEGLQTNLDTLNAQSYADNFVNNLRAQAASAQNPWLGLATTMLGRGAQATATNWGSGGSPSGNPAASDYTIAQQQANEANPPMQPINANAANW